MAMPLEGAWLAVGREAVCEGQDVRSQETAVYGEDHKVVDDVICSSRPRGVGTR